jgi:hypothetical protein
MPNINEISTAVYRLLKADPALEGMCRLYKGTKRPARAKNPSLTVEARRLEPGQGEGIWMCDVAVTAYVDVLADGASDSGRLEEIVSRVQEVLADAEVELEGAKTLPLIEGENSGPEWQSAHDREVYQESVFGLVFIKF